MYSKKDIEAKQSECIKFYVNYTVHSDLLVKVKVNLDSLMVDRGEVQTLESRLMIHKLLKRRLLLNESNDQRRRVVAD